MASKGRKQRLSPVIEMGGKAWDCPDCRHREMEQTWGSNQLQREGRQCYSWRLCLEFEGLTACPGYLHHAHSWLPCHFKIFAWFLSLEMWSLACNCRVQSGFAESEWEEEYCWPLSMQMTSKMLREKWDQCMEHRSVHGTARSRQLQLLWGRVDDFNII